MYKNSRVGVVVPAFNEQVLLGRVLETMPEFVDRIYVVDDCSKDATSAVVERYAALAAYRERVVLIRHATNRGVGASIVSGYERAQAEGVDLIAVMAGDAQMDPNDLPAILDPVVEGWADYSKGNRLFTGHAWKMIPRHRYLGNAVLSLLTKIASGYWHVADSQSGYTAISLQGLMALPLNRLFPRYGYPNHTLVLLNVREMRVADVPVHAVYNIGEKSGIQMWKVIPSLSWRLTGWFWWRMTQKYVIRDFHPLIFFYSMGCAAVALACVLLIRILVLWPQLGHIPGTSFLAFTFLGISGIQLILFAMWFDMQHNEHLSANPPRSPPPSTMRQVETQGAIASLPDSG